MKSITKIDSRGRIALSPKIRAELNADIGNYVKIEKEKDKFVITKVDI